MATENLVVERIKGVLSYYLDMPVSAIDSRKDLIAEYHIDSIDFVEILLHLESEFDLDPLVLEDVLGQSSSILGLARMIAEKMELKQEGAPNE